jgi:AcrR family transcriptional regulator
MPRRNRSDERRNDLLAPLAAAFAERGYRRATTAELAERCNVQETVLYRLWPDKRAMFIAAIEFVGTNSERIWQEVLASGRSSGTTAERVLAHEAKHLGEFGLYRILFAGWSETDDPAIADALRAVYGRFLRFVQDRVGEHRATRKGAHLPDPELTAWALVGLATAVNMGRELQLLPDRARERLLQAVGQLLLG